MRKINIMVVTLAMAAFTLACVSEAAISAPAASAASSVTAQGAAQAGVAGVVAGSDIQSMIEGERWEDSDHAVAKHGQDAVMAREAIRHNGPSCNDYKCGNKYMRACGLDGGMYAVAWFAYRGSELPLREDTAFLTTRDGLLRMIGNHNCQLWQWPEGW